MPGGRTREGGSGRYATTALRDDIEWPLLAAGVVASLAKAERALRGRAAVRVAAMEIMREEMGREANLRIDACEQTGGLKRGVQGGSSAVCAVAKPEESLKMRRSSQAGSDVTAANGAKCNEQDTEHVVVAVSNDKPVMGNRIGKKCVDVGRTANLRKEANRGKKWVGNDGCSELCAIFIPEESPEKGRCASGSEGTNAECASSDEQVTAPEVEADRAFDQAVVSMKSRKREKKAKHNSAAAADESHGPAPLQAAAELGGPGPRHGATTAVVEAGSGLGQQDEVGLVSGSRTQPICALDDQPSDDEWFLNTLQSRLEAEFAELCGVSKEMRAVVQANIDLLVEGALK